MGLAEGPTPEEVVKRLEDFLEAVTGDTRDWSEFYLRIPADPHHDSDFIFIEAARLIREAYLPTPNTPKEK